MAKPLSAEEFRERMKRKSSRPAEKNGRPKEPQEEPPPPAGNTTEEWLPFPVDALPTAAREFVVEGSASLCVDPSFVALPVLTLLAALIGTTRNIQLRPQFVQPAAIWTAYFGDSGSNKSSAYELAFGHLAERQMLWRNEYNQEMEEYALNNQIVGQVMADGKKLPEPILRQIWTTDATVESLTDLMVSGNRGALVASSELSGFIDSMSRYKASSDRARWLEFYDGHSSFVNRKNSKTAKVIRSACVSITGGIQPRIFYRSMNDEHLASGLGARFLLAWPPPREKLWKVPPLQPGTKSAWRRLCDSLLSIRHDQDDTGDDIPRTCYLSTEADSLYGEWFEDFHKRVDQAKNPHLKAAWAKMFGQAGRLALIHHVCNEAVGLIGNGNNTVTDCSVSKALTLIRWFAGQASKVYGDEAVDVSLVAWIQDRGGVTSVRDLITGKRFDNRDNAARALEDLVSAGRGQWSKEGKKEIFSLSEI